MLLAANRFYVYTYSYPDKTPFYVGKGTAFRFKRHLTDVKYSNKADTWCKKIIKSLLNKGQEPIIKKIVENIDNEFAVLVEQEYIAKYGRKDLGTGILVNCTAGGDGGIDLSPEVKAKHTERILKVGMKTRFKKGLIPWNKGGHHSEQSNEKNRQSHLGKVLTEEHKQKVSEGLKKVSCATRFKKGHISWITGKKQLPHVIEAVRQSRLGKKNTPEHNAKISAGNMGRKVSPITMEKLKMLNLNCNISCPHCNIVSNKGAMARWHMDNCKFKENI